MKTISAWILVLSALPLGVAHAVSELSVTVTGQGRVVSEPLGIDCTSSGGVGCSYDFPENTPVALKATPAELEEGSAVVIGYSGDCTSTSDICAVYLSGGDQSVTAAFGALGDPAFLDAVPDSQEVFHYQTATETVLTPTHSAARPIAVGDDPDNIDLQVALPPFASDVDVYVGLYHEDFGMWFVNSFKQLRQVGMHTLSPYKTTDSAFDESIFGPIPMGDVPPGYYSLFVMVTPAGDPSKWYLWQSGAGFFSDDPADNPFFP